jgi:hypothetical protein
MKGAFELFLSASHWLDAMTPPLEQHLERLTDAVRSILSIKTVPPTPGVEASVPTVAAAVNEVSPDLWSRRPGGRIRQFVSRFLEDTES